jgi:SAM-dependent methyltransferase
MDFIATNEPHYSAMEMQMSEQERRPDTVRLQNMGRAFINSASLFAAIDLELFTCVAQGDDTHAKVAQRAGISITNAERLMTMCAASGLLVWKEDRYENAADVDRFLVRGKDTYAAPWLTFTRSGWGRWQNLTEILRDSTPPTVVPDLSRMTVDAARRYHRATASVGFGSGRRFARQVNLSGRKRLLDIGGGSGAYSIVAVQHNPELSAVVFDIPPVAVVTAEFIAQHGVSDRVSTCAGDFTSDDFPSGIDVALMASNLPMYNREIIAAVIQKAYDALLPGGEMHLIGEMLDDDRSGPADAALWGLMEALSNSTGIAHTRAECVGYLERAGFDDVSANEFIPDVLVRVSGLKR